MKPLKKPGLVVFYTGLIAALSLGVMGSCSLRHVPVPLAEIERMDAKAQPHFEEARRNIPAVVDKLTKIGTTCRLCWLMARDKFAGTNKTQEYLALVLEKPIVEPCRKGAKLYGCDFKAAGFLDNLKSINADYAEIEVYAVSGLAIESLFLKQTIAALSSTLGSIVARLSVAFGSGAACAVADGPFPFGDAVAEDFMPLRKRKQTDCPSLRRFGTMIRHLWIAPWNESPFRTRKSPILRARR